VVGAAVEVPERLEIAYSGSTYERLPPRLDALALPGSRAAGPGTR
jgi:hypothetical protein